LPNEPRWVSVEAVIALNRAEVAKTGERHHLVDRAALEIAVKRPWNVWVYFMDQDYATLAMSLLVAIAGAKPFAAGNERTAYRAATALIENNGLILDLGANRPRAEERLFDYFQGRLSQSGVADWFRTWMTPAESER
jgi:prophage maintenance system killer protein